MYRQSYDNDTYGLLTGQTFYYRYYVFINDEPPRELLLPYEPRPEEEAGIMRRWFEKEFTVRQAKEVEGEDGKKRREFRTVTVQRVGFDLTKARRGRVDAVVVLLHTGKKEAVVLNAVMKSEVRMCRDMFPSVFKRRL